MTTRLSPKVLLIGWDAADWRMIRPLIQAGLMPTLAGLIDRGASGNLATIHPVLSPILWTSIATGKRADKHGIHGFVEPQPDGSGIRPVNSTSRTTKAIWNILSQSGLRSNVVGWFASHPAEPIQGAVVTDYYVHPATLRGGAPAADMCHPARLATPLANLRVDPADLDAEALLPFVPQAAKIDFANDRRLMELASLLARTSSIHAAACALLVNEPWDFMAVYYDAIDQFGHHFMPYHPPRMAGVSELDAEIYQHVMTGCYRFHDMMLETLLAHAGPDATVILASDHGFQSGDRRQDVDGFKNPTSWHRQHGVVCVAGPGIERGAPLHGATLLDIVPTILTLFGLPIGADMDGRPWLEILDRQVRPDRIPSWDEAAGPCGSHAPDRREDSVAAVEAIRHLVDLGYIAPPADDVQETIDRTIVDLKTNLAWALVDGGKHEQALETWQVVLDLVQNDQALRRICLGEMARCCMRLGRYEQCDALLADLLRESPDDPSIHFRAAQLDLRRGHPAEALARLAPMREQPAYADAIDCLAGQAHLLLQQWDSAEEAFRRVLAGDEDNAEAYAGLATIALQRGEFQEAAELAIQAVGLHHHLPSAHMTLGLALAECQCEAEAIHALETALGMAPDLHLAHRKLAQLRRAQGVGPA